MTDSGPLFVSMCDVRLCTLRQVWECNGEKVLNLKHLVSLIERGEKVVYAPASARAHVRVHTRAVLQLSH
jgi:hypothetical protein